MPLPKPKNKENRSEFVSRCIQDLNDKGEMKDNSQRIAVCYTQWKDAKASADVIIGSGDEEVIIYSQEKFGGKKRSDLKDSDFLYPNDRSFPIVTPQDVKDAVSSFGRSKGKDYEDFKKRLVRKARSKGAEFVSALPDTIKEEFKIKANIEEAMADLREDYIAQAKKVISEILHAANKVSECLEDDTCKDRAIEAWVFEKMVLSKAKICGVKNYIKFGKEDSEEDNSEEGDSEDDMRIENIELVEPAKIASEDEIREKVYNNKFGADTY